jgi:hypothetical protein
MRRNHWLAGTGHRMPKEARQVLKRAEPDAG